MNVLTNLANRTVVVTGGGSGIGRASAHALASRGATVVIAGRRIEPLARVAETLDNTHAVAVDVTKMEDVERLVTAAVSAGGGIDAIVNNAGFMRPTPADVVDVATARALWETNVLGPTMLVAQAIPELARRSGAIVNISSTLATKAGPGVGQYAASKAAIEHLTRTWALELAPRGIRVNAVAPGPTESDALASAGFSSDEIDHIERQERDRIPLGRRGTPEDVAPWVVALVDPAAAWTTGQVLGVDGGFGLN